MHLKRFGPCSNFFVYTTTKIRNNSNYKNDLKDIILCAMLHHNQHAKVHLCIGLYDAYVMYVLSPNLMSHLMYRLL